MLYSTDLGAAEQGRSATNRPLGDDEAGDVAIHPDFAPEPGDVVIRKTWASAFLATWLLADLRAAPSARLCSAPSPRAGASAPLPSTATHGFHIVVVEDAV